MPRIDLRLLRQHHQLLPDRTYQFSHTPCGKICPADRRPEQGVPAEKYIFLRDMITAASCGMPRRMDHPDLNAAFIENYEPTSAYGTKALGEPPTCSPAPAIRNAILQAVDVALQEIPIRPHLLFEEFRKAGLI